MTDLRNCAAGTNPTRNELSGKRIAFIFGGGGFGGGERQALVLARHLRTKCGADVQILPWLNPDPNMAGRYKQYDVPWQTCPFNGWHPATRLNMLTRLLKYVTQLRKHKLDMLIPFMMDANLVGGIVWPWVGAKGSIWNQVDEGRERRPGRWERLAVRRTSCFISNSIHGGNFLKETLGAAPERVHVIYNGISPEPVEVDRKEWRSRLGIGEEAFVAFMPANLTEYKDHATLINAWRIVVNELSRRNTTAVLALAGRNGSQSTFLKVLAYDLDLGRSVRFLGYVKDIAGLAEASDLCVFSSRIEGCPNAVLECMAAGLAVAGTDIPGIREAVGSDNHKYLAAPGDAGALAERILLLTREPALRREIGRRNRKRVAEVFSEEQMCLSAVSLIAGHLQAEVPRGVALPRAGAVPLDAA